MTHKEIMDALDLLIGKSILIGGTKHKPLRDWKLVSYFDKIYSLEFENKNENKNLNEKQIDELLKENKIS